MKIHRFIGPYDLAAERMLIRDVDTIHQIRQVLKLKSGEKIVLSDGGGQEAAAVIRDLSKNAIEVEVTGRRQVKEPNTRVTLYCAILKNENFEYAVQKATEAGAAAIVPVITARTVKLGLKADRLARIAKEAAEQSGRANVPELGAPLAFRQALDAAAANACNLFFDQSGEYFSHLPLNCSEIGVWIGPEGGWEEDEIAAAAARDFDLLSLGPNMLRAETAATVAVYLASQYGIISR